MFYSRCFFKYSHFLSKKKNLKCVASICITEREWQKKKKKRVWSDESNKSQSWFLWSEPLCFQLNLTTRPPQTQEHTHTACSGGPGRSENKELLAFKVDCHKATPPPPPPPAAPPPPPPPPPVLLAALFMSPSLPLSGLIPPLSSPTGKKKKKKKKKKVSKHKAKDPLILIVPAGGWGRKMSVAVSVFHTLLLLLLRPLRVR